MRSKDATAVDLPFAAPLLALDGLTVDETDGGVEIRAWKHVDDEDPHLAAHFPGFTIFPGVFVLESVRQAVALALGGFPDLVCVRSARFLHPLLAGDTMTLDATVGPAGAGGSFSVEATCRRGDGTTAARVSVEMRSD
jgi:3-hydroxyacyl-[acyl-carrier-protein] dehydratase